MGGAGTGMRASQEARWRRNVKETAARRRRVEKLAEEQKAQEELERKQALERRKMDRDLSDRFLRQPSSKPPEPKKPILRKGAGAQRYAGVPKAKVAKPASQPSNKQHLQAQLREHVREQRELVKQRAKHHAKAPFEDYAVGDAGVGWQTARKLAAQGLDSLLHDVIPASSPPAQLAPVAVNAEANAMDMLVKEFGPSSGRPDGLSANREVLVQHHQWGCVNGAATPQLPEESSAQPVTHSGEACGTQTASASYSGNGVVDETGIGCNEGKLRRGVTAVSRHRACPQNVACDEVTCSPVPADEGEETEKAPEMLPAWAKLAGSFSSSEQGASVGVPPSQPEWALLVASRNENLGEGEVAEQSLNCSRASMGPVGDSAQSFDFGVAPSTSFSAAADGGPTAQDNFCNPPDGAEIPRMFGVRPDPAQADAPSSSLHQKVGGVGCSDTATAHTVPTISFRGSPSSETHPSDAGCAVSHSADHSLRQIGLPLSAHVSEDPCQRPSHVPDSSGQPARANEQADSCTQHELCTAGLTWNSPTADMAAACYKGVQNRVDIACGSATEEVNQRMSRPSGNMEVKLGMQSEAGPALSDDKGVVQVGSKHQPSSACPEIELHKTSSIPYACPEVPSMLPSASGHEAGDLGVEGVRERKGSYAAAMDATRKRARKEMEQRARLAAELAKRKAHVAAREREQKAEKERGISKSPARGARRGGYAPNKAPEKTPGASDVRKKRTPCPAPATPNEAAPHACSRRDCSTTVSPAPAARAAFIGSTTDKVNVSFELSDGSDDNQELPDDWEEQMVERKPALTRDNASHGPRQLGSKFASSPLAAALLQLMGLPGAHSQYPGLAPSRKQISPTQAPADEVMHELSAQEDALLKSLSRLDPQLLRKSLKSAGVDLWSKKGRKKLSNSAEQEILLASLERLDAQLAALHVKPRKEEPQPTTMPKNPEAPRMPVSRYKQHSSKVPSTDASRALHVRGACKREPGRKASECASGGDAVPHTTNSSGMCRGEGGASHLANGQQARLARPVSTNECSAPTAAHQRGFVDVSPGASGPPVPYLFPTPQGKQPSYFPPGYHWPVHQYPAQNWVGQPSARHFPPSPSGMPYPVPYAGHSMQHVAPIYPYQLPQQPHELQGASNGTAYPLFQQQQQQKQQQQKQTRQVELLSRNGKQCAEVPVSSAATQGVINSNKALVGMLFS